MPGDWRRIGIKVPPTASAREAMDLAYEVLAYGARQNGERFRRPDDDWAPAWLVLTKTQGTLVTGDGDKYQMVDYVAQLARRFGALAVGHLHSSWMVHFEDVGGTEQLEEIRKLMIERGGSTEGFPRREILLIQAIAGVAVREYHAAILRADDAPPTLAPFELVADTSDQDAMRVEGAMIDPIVDALKTIG